MATLPDRPPQNAGNLPERALTSREVEAVIRRAVELQAAQTDVAGVGGGGMDAAELVRIGQELGISPVHVQQALAEVRSGPSREEMVFGRGFGDSRAVASRHVRDSAERVGFELDAYLRDQECMVVHRRMPGRTLYTQSSGAVWAIKRAARRFGSRYPLLQVNSLEVGIQPIDEKSCYVALAVDLTSQRTGLAAGSILAGGGTGGVAATVGAIAVAPPVALIGVPILLGTVVGMRSIYRHTLRQTCEKLESLLDRLEHRELLGSPRTPPRRLGR